MRAPVRSPRRPGGFTYITVLIILAIFSGGLAVLGEVWHTAAQREREAELLFVGGEYRRAIQQYYLNGPGQYPRSLSDLIKDPRKPVVERYLRQLYPDPITGKNEWGLIKAPDGGIMGVYSLSQDRPLKTANLGRVSVATAGLEGKDAKDARSAKDAKAPQDPKEAKEVKYSDWKFVPTTEELGGSGASGAQPRGAAVPAAKPAIPR